MTTPVIPSATTKAADWWKARLRGQRLEAHELRCVECGEPCEAVVCAACIETRLQAEIHQ